MQYSLASYPSILSSLFGFFGWILCVVLAFFGRCFAVRLVDRTPMREAREAKFLFEK
jgi:hypothetical protein